jgi:hypothetical protein
LLRHCLEQLRGLGGVRKTKPSIAATPCTRPGVSTETNPRDTWKRAVARQDNRNCESAKSKPTGHKATRRRRSPSPIDCAEIRKRIDHKASVCRDIRRHLASGPRSGALDMAHIGVAEGTGGLRPPFRNGQGLLNIQLTAGSIPVLATRLPLQ